MTRYIKLPLDYDEILIMLRERGLIISDDSQAVECLKVVSYFRLANYLRPMETDKLVHAFKPNSYFDNAVDLYVFDKELRMLIFDAVQSVEIALRSKMIHYISLQYGAFWIFEESLFDDTLIYNTCVQRIRQEVERSREDFIIDHFEKYTEPSFPPVWKTLEVVTFGTLSKLFNNFKDNRLKKRIAREFNLPQHLILENWIKCTVIMRNQLAHHTRVWNRNFPYIPQTNVPLRGAWITHCTQQSHKLYPYLCCIQYLLDSINPENNFSQNLNDLLEKHPNVDVSAMDFPQDWKTEELWCR